jgi:very-short-patch-repair endonuclease
VRPTWPTATLDRVSDLDDWRSLPSDNAPEFDWLLFRQNQVLRLDQALSGLGRGALQNLLARGRWQRAGRRVVVAHNGPLTRRQRVWVAILSAGSGAICSGTTAASLAGLRGYDNGLVHLLMPDERQVRATPGTVVHRTSILPADHLLSTTPPHTTMARALFDAAAWARTDNDARAIVAAAFQQKRVIAEEICAVAAVLTRSRRRALVLETATYAAGGAHSLSEVDLVRLCRRFHLPLPDHQVQRTDRGGRRRYLDAYWAEWQIHVEVDGAFHLDVRAWWADMRRQNDLWVKGDRVLRFPAWVVARHPEEVAKQIRAALCAAGWSR